MPTPPSAWNSVDRCGARDDPICPKVTDAKGQVKEYRLPDSTDQAISSGNRATMDHIDCHNTVGHPISQTPELAVDRAIAAAQVSRDLPFVRREGVRLLKASYPSPDEAAQAIDQGLRGLTNPEAVPATGRRSHARWPPFRRCIAATSSQR